MNSFLQFDPLTLMLAVTVALGAGVVKGMVGFAMPMIMISVLGGFLRPDVALAALIFGKWRPFPAFFACLMFGLLDAISIRLQGVEIKGIGEIPVQLVQALRQGPRAAWQSIVRFRVFLLCGLVMMLLSAQMVAVVPQRILLAGFIGRAVAPKAIGIPFSKER